MKTLWENKTDRKESPHTEHNLILQQSASNWNISVNPPTMSVCQNRSLRFHLMLVNNSLFSICNTCLMQCRASITAPALWEKGLEQGSKQGQHEFNTRPDWRSREHGVNVCKRSGDLDLLEAQHSFTIQWSEKRLIYCSQLSVSLEKIY